MRVLSLDVAIQVPELTAERIVKLAVEDLRFIGVWLADEANQLQGPQDYEVDSNRRSYACRAFSLSGMMTGRLLNQLSEPGNKAKFNLAKRLLRDGWSEADILAHPDFDIGSQNQAALDPASVIKAQREALALDMAAGRCTPEEWATRYQRLALADLTLSGADPRTMLALMDRTLFANPAATAPRLQSATTEATESEAELAAFLSDNGDE